MELTKTAKLQIYISDSDKNLLLDSMRAYSDACNHVSRYIYTTKDLSQASVQKHTYDVCRSAYGLPSQMACNVVRTVIGSYKTNKTNGFEWTECRYNVPQMTLSWNRDYSLNEDKFSVGTLRGHIESANRNKAKHLFCCKNCGYSSNDDRIGTMNLYRMGIEYLVESQVSTSDLRGQ